MRLLVLNDRIDHFVRRPCCGWMLAGGVAYGFTIFGDNEIRVAAPEPPQFRSFDFAMHCGHLWVEWTLEEAQSLRQTRSLLSAKRQAALNKLSRL